MCIRDSLGAGNLGHALANYAGFEKRGFVVSAVFDVKMCIRDSTYDEQKTMMTLWCIFQSPLMLGAELTKLDEETLSLLCNQKVLALFELPAGQAKEIIRDDTVIVWKTGDYAAIFNVSGFDCMVNISELLEIQEKEFAKMCIRDR